jgi:lipoprotein-anchoring transpeptidase ErfK/SrfK
VRVYSVDDEGNKDSLVKTMICSSGRDGKTPLRTWIVLDNETQHDEITDTDFLSHYDFEWVKGCAVQYITRMWKAEWDDNGKLKVTTSSYLFHSTPFDSKDKNTLRAEDWNKLGYAVSDGCVRLCVRDAHWIYSHVAPYSVVRTVEGEKDQETWNALKLPDIPEYVKKDPTDVY